MLNKNLKSKYPSSRLNIRDALRNLFLLVRFKIHRKHMEECYFQQSYRLACKITKINTPLWVFFTFFKLYKWYQIMQSITLKNIYPHSWMGSLPSIWTNDMCFFKQRILITAVIPTTRNKWVIIQIPQGYNKHILTVQVDCIP